MRGCLCALVFSMTAGASSKQGSAHYTFVSFINPDDLIELTVGAKSLLQSFSGPVQFKFFYSQLIPDSKAKQLERTLKHVLGNDVPMYFYSYGSKFQALAQMWGEMFQKASVFGDPSNETNLFNLLSLALVPDVPHYLIFLPKMLFRSDLKGLYDACLESRQIAIGTYLENLVPTLPVHNNRSIIPGLETLLKIPYMNLLWGSLVFVNRGLLAAELPKLREALTAQQLRLGQQPAFPSPMVPPQILQAQKAQQALVKSFLKAWMFNDQEPIHQKMSNWLKATLATTHPQFDPRFGVQRFVFHLLTPKKIVSGTDVNDFFSALIAFHLDAEQTMLVINPMFNVQNQDMLNSRQWLELCSKVRDALDQHQGQNPEVANDLTQRIVSNAESFFDGRWSWGCRPPAGVVDQNGVIDAEFLLYCVSQTLQTLQTKVDSLCGTYWDKPKWLDAFSDILRQAASRDKAAADQWVTPLIMACLLSPEALIRLRMTAAGDVLARVWTEDSPFQVQGAPSPKVEEVGHEEKESINEDEYWGHLCEVLSKLSPEDIQGFQELAAFEPYNDRIRQFLADFG